MAIIPSLKFADSKRWLVPQSTVCIVELFVGRGGLRAADAILRKINDQLIAPFGAVRESARRIRALLKMESH
jgi:hypothetical protein